MASFHAWPLEQVDDVSSGFSLMIGPAKLLSGQLAACGSVVTVGGRAVVGELCQAGCKWEHGLWLVCRVAVTLDAVTAKPQTRG